MSSLFPWRGCLMLIYTPRHMAQTEQLIYKLNTPKMWDLYIQTSFTKINEESLKCTGNSENLSVQYALGIGFIYEPGRLSFRELIMLLKLIVQILCFIYFSIWCRNLESCMEKSARQVKFYITGIECWGACRGKSTTAHIIKREQALLPTKVSNDYQHLHKVVVARLKRDLVVNLWHCVEILVTGDSDYKLPISCNEQLRSVHNMTQGSTSPYMRFVACACVA